jgi:hypothetical protein
MFPFLAALACAPDTVEAEVGFVENACGPIAAMQAGRKWSYASLEGADTQAAWTSEVRMLRGVTARVWTSGSLSGPKITEDFSRTSEYQCDQGTWLRSEEEQAAGVEAGVSTSRSTRVEYDEPVLLWPSDITNGATWQSHYLGTSTTDGKSTAIDRTVDYVVKAPADLEIEAGQFHAFQVVATGDDGAEWRFWVAREVGVVKGQDYQLMALW